MYGLSPSFWTTLNGQCFISAWTIGSLNRLPISLLASKTEFSGFCKDQLVLKLQCVLKTYHGDLVLCSVTNESFGVCKGNIARCGSVTLIVCNNFNSIILPYSNT